MRAVSLVAACLALLQSTAGLAQTRFFPDDPIRQDPDRMDTPDKPQPIRLSDIYDRLVQSFHVLGDAAYGSEALNVNTLDEVPDSSWYTNRHASSPLSIEQLVRGPGAAPARPPFTIVKGKSEGVSLGFEIDDAAGRHFLIKLDREENPELTSAAEAITTRFFHALGYNVPQNDVVFFERADLRLDPEATFVDEAGDTEHFGEDRLDAILERSWRGEDGRYRGIASLFLEGEALGPFRYFGTRPDDPNDIFAHERRRELRGMRVFAAWLSHDDTRDHNTLDMWVEDEGRHSIRHNLIDFGSALGSGLHDMLIPNAAIHFWIEPPLVRPVDKTKPSCTL